MINIEKDDNKNNSLAELLASLTPDEAALFQKKLSKIHVKAKQRIFQQGECDSRLIFIESGMLKLCYRDYAKNKDVVFTHLGKGNICGSETFFSFSPHTSTLSALEDTIISCLYKMDYQKLLSKYPSIEGKLIKYCEKRQKKIVFHNPQEVGRRAYKRYPTSLEGQIQKNVSGKTNNSKVLTVKIMDISIGGLSCAAQKLEIKEAALFYKSMVWITISYLKNSWPCDIQMMAKVVSVRFTPFGESTIHLQFQIPMSEKKLNEIIQPGNVYIYS